MLRTLTILLLTGFLIVSVGGDVVLFRQSAANAAEADQERARAIQAEQAENGSQTQPDQPSAPVAPPPPPAGGSNSDTGTAPDLSVPTPSADLNGRSGPSLTLLHQIETQVEGIRGLSSKTDVPLKFIDAAGLHQYLADSFQRDYLPTDQEADQDLLQTLGLLQPGQNLVQIELQLLDDQVSGLYDPDSRTMYIVGDSQSFGPAAEITFAEEYTHALQDQYYGLYKLAPLHPTNDDAAAAAHAVIAGDATLVQQIWAHQNLTPSQIDEAAETETSAGAGDENMPNVVREEASFSYQQGLLLVEHAYQQAQSFSAVNAILAAPPLSTAQVLEPERYTRQVQAQSVDLPDLSTPLGAGWQEVRSNVLGELDLQILLEQYSDPTSATRVANGWAGDRWELLENANHPSLVLKTAWLSTAQAQQFFTLYAQDLNKRFSDAKAQTDDASHLTLTSNSAGVDLQLTDRTVTAVITPDSTTLAAILQALAAAASAGG